MIIQRSHRFFVEIADLNYVLELVFAYDLHTHAFIALLLVIVREDKPHLFLELFIFGELEMEFLREENKT